MLSYFTSSTISWAFLHFSFFYFTIFHMCGCLYEVHLFIHFFFILFFKNFCFVLMCASFILYVFSMQMLVFLFSLRFFMAQVFVQLQPWTRFDIYKVILLLFIYFYFFVFVPCFVLFVSTCFALTCFCFLQCILLFM